MVQKNTRNPTEGKLIRRKAGQPRKISKQPEMRHHVNELELFGIMNHVTLQSSMTAFVNKLVLATWRNCSMIYEVFSSFQTEHDVWL